MLLFSLPLLFGLAAPAAAQTNVTVSLSADTDANEGSSGTTDKHFHINFSSTFSQDVDVRFCTAGGTATRATPTGGSPFVSAYTFSGSEDYILHNNSLISVGCITRTVDASTLTTFPAVTFRIRGDTESEPSETIIGTISLVNPPAGVTLGTSTATYTIRNDDDPYVTVEGGNAVTEGGNAQFTFHSDPAPSSAFTVDYDITQSGSFLASGDLGSKEITIPSGTSTVVRNVATQADSTDEPNGSVTVTVNSGSGYTVGTPSSATVTVNDDDDAPADTTAPRVTSIARQSPSSSPTNADSITWRVTFNEAVRNVDMTDFAMSAFSSRVHELPGTTLAVSQVGSTNAWDVTASGTGVSGTSGRVYLLFASAQNIQDAVGNALTNTTPTGTNHNSFELDHAGPEVSSITRQSPTTSPTDADSLTWRVTFDDRTDIQNVDTADFEVSGTTATVTGTSQVGSTKAWDVTVSGGDLASLDGTVTLGFASAQDIQDEAGNALTSTTPTGTNHNSFVVKNTALVLSTSTLTMAEGTTGTYTVKLATQPSGTVTVAIASDNGDVTVNPASLTFTGSGATIWSTAQTVTVAASHDNDTSNDTATLTHTASGGGYGSVTGTVDVTVTDDDTTASLSDEDWISLSNDSAATEVEERLGKTSRFTVSRVIKSTGRPPTNAWGFRLCFTGTAEPNVDYTLKHRSGGVTIGENGCTRTDHAGDGTGVRAGSDRVFYTISYLDDPHNEGTETVTVTLDNPVNSSLFGGKVGLGNKVVPYGGTTVTYTILDTEDARPACKAATSNDEYVKSKAEYRDLIRWLCLWREKVWVISFKDVQVHYDRALLALGVDRNQVDGQGAPITAMTRAEAQAHVDEGEDWWLWHDVVDALTDLEQRSPGQPARASTVEIPTTAVANVQVSAVDDASASVTWDAVEHATRYLVAFEGQGTDPLSYTQGSETVTGTSTTFRHDAIEAMTLTVTVTPQYLDGDGQTQTLDSLAGTATLDVAPGGTQSADSQSADSQADARSSCVSDALLADVDVRIASQHTDRWTRVRNALTGKANALPLSEMRVIYDRRTANGWPTWPWPDVLEAMECLETADEPASVPEVTVSAGGGVTEGTAASFTVTASPAPASPLDVTLTVGQSGDVAAPGAAGTRTVTVPVSGSVSVAVATDDDSVDDSDGSVSVTVDAGAGYTVGSASAGTVSVADNDPAPAITPVLSLSAGSAVDEGGSASFTVTASPTPQSDLTVEYTVAQGGAVLAAPGAGSRTATLAAGSASVTLDVATENDGVNESDGSVSVTLDAGAGYTVAAGEASAAVTVRDDDEPVLSIAAGIGVTEGATASFTLTASPAPHAPLDVTVTVAQSGDFAASGATGTKTVTVPASGSVTLDVATEDDSVDEPDGSIAATLAAGTGYTVAAAPGNAASVKVADNDAAAAGPTISISDATFREGQGLGYFTVTLSKPVDRRVRFQQAARDSTPVSARSGEDYRAYPLRNLIPAGQTEGRVYVYILDDSHDEEAETFEIVLSNPSAGVTIADGVAVGTIVNDDPMPAAWLARFGRTAAEQALDGIAGRMAAPRTPGFEATLAGQMLRPGHAAETAGMTPTERRAAKAERDAELAMAELARTIVADRDADGLDGDPHGQSLAMQSRSMTAKEAMLGTRFSLTGARDGAGGTLAFWGRAAQSSFDGREGTFSLDGEATTAMLGADYARGRWLVGLALMQTSGEGGYADSGAGPQACPDDMDPQAKEVLCNGAVREGDGDVEASLTAAVPYAAIQASERLKLWGAAGHGTGEVTLKPEVGGTLKSDLSWTMAAAGLRGDVIAPPAEGSGPALAVTSDALWARTSSDRTHDLVASESDVTRLRLGLEGSWRVALEGGGTVVPKLEVGARHDGGDAETGFGVELGGGVAWTDPALGLTLDLSGRTLVAHEDGDLKDRGVLGLGLLGPGAGDGARAVAQHAPGVRRRGARRA